MASVSNGIECWASMNMAMKLQVQYQGISQSDAELLTLQGRPCTMRNWSVSQAALFQYV